MSIEKSTNRKSKVRYLPIFAVLLIASFLVVFAVAPPMAVLSFTTAWTSESIYQIQLTIQNPSTYAYSVYTLTTTNMSSGITIPAGYTMTNIACFSNQSASRFTSAFKPETDSYITVNITSPSGSVSTQTSLTTPYAFNSTDWNLGIGYSASATYYWCIGQWLGIQTLSTGTWTISITTFTQ